MWTKFNLGLSGISGKVQDAGTKLDGVVAKLQEVETLGTKEQMQKDLAEFDREAGNETINDSKAWKPD